MLGRNAVGNPEPYQKVRKNQDLLTKAAQDDNVNYERTSEVGSDSGPESQEIAIPLLTEVEVSVIYNEKVQEFFQLELDQVVCFFIHSHRLLAHHLSARSH